MVACEELENTSLMVPLVLSVIFLIIGVMPILSAPLTTPVKNVSQPKPIIAKNNTIAIIHKITPILLHSTFLMYINS
jgi:hypothetical protein